MDDSMASFAAITGASAEQAQQYLTLTDGNLEQAVQLFYDDPSLASAPSAPPPIPTASRPTQPASRRAQREVITIDSDDEDFAMDEDDDDDVREVSSRPLAAQRSMYTDDDAEMARRMQESEYQTTGGQSGEENVRAPMARTTETLVGGPDYDDGDDITAMVREQMIQRQMQRSAGRTGIFNQRQMPSNIWDGDQGYDSRARNLATATGGASTTSSKSNLLAEMFRPPFEIMSRLPWDQARDEGREEEKWLIVNVQDSSIFDCQALNRDLWKNKEIKDCIKEHFIFIQYQKDDPRGQSYFSYYLQGLLDNPAGYPHIAIVDPRTGEQVKVWSGPPVPSANDFLMQLYEFLDRYSLKAGARNPVAKRKSEAKNFDAMTEDEQLQWALNNSMEGGAPGMDVDDPDDLTRSVNLGKGKDRADDLIDLTDEPAVQAQVTSPAPQEETAFSQIPSDRPHTEPAADPTTSTRIQFRSPQGRTVRRFAMNDTVQRLYEYLKADQAEKGSSTAFELVFINKNLIESLEQTIEEAGLKNASVTVSYDEAEE